MKILVFVMCMLASLTVWATQTPTQVSPKAQTEHSVQTPSDRFKNEFDELLKSDKYSKIHQSKKWVKDRQEEKEYKPKDYGAFEEFLNFLESLSLGLGRVGKFILLVLLAIFVVWLVLKYQDSIVALVKKGRKRRTSVSLKELILETEVFDGVPIQESLYKTAKALFDKGQLVACLSLLYRGTLRLHNVAYELPINKSQTEAQCQALLDNTSSASDDEKRFFGQLIELWQVLAYGQGSADAYQERIYGVLMAFNRLYPADFEVQGVDDGEV